MTGYIYKTTNLKNGKIYIGQHRGSFNPRYLGSGKLLKYAIRKYGKEYFKVEILKEAESIDDLDHLEREYVASYKKIFPNEIYNLMDGGFGTPGREPSNKWRQAMIKAHVGVERSEASKQKMSERQKGSKNIWFGKVPPNIEACRKGLKEKYPEGTMKGYKFDPDVVSKRNAKRIETMRLKRIENGIKECSRVA